MIDLTDAPIYWREFTARCPYGGTDCTLCPPTDDRNHIAEPGPPQYIREEFHRHCRAFHAERRIAWSRREVRG